MDGRRIADRYELHEQLGESSWRATDAELGRDVVVRLAPSGALGAAPLSHPSIARVFDHGEADGERFAVREYLPGGSLAERDPSTLSESAAHAAATDVGAALAFAHEHGVAHGSLDEANVLFDAEGRAKVADFGGTGEPRDDVLAFGAILGTLAAAAPALDPIAAAALAGEIESAELVGRLEAVAPAAPAPEPATLVERPPHRAAAPPRRRSVVVGALLAGATLLAAGIGAAFLATSEGSDTTEPTTDSTPVSSAATTDAVEETTEPEEAPPPAPTTDETESTTTGTTTAKTTTAKTTTAPPPTTTAPPPTTTAPPPTTTAPPTTETEPPPTETEPPPTTTEPGDPEG